MDDIIYFIMEYIVAPFAMLIVVGLIAFCIIGVFFIPSCIKHDQEVQKKIEECFMQEPRTKECEYILWQYELKKKEPKHNTTVMPMPMIVR